MLAVLACGILSLAVVVLVFFTVHKMNPGRFRLQASLWRLFSFTVEIEASSKPGSRAGVSAPGSDLRKSVLDRC